MRTKPTRRVRRFLKDVVAETPFARMLLVLVGLWAAFSIAMYTVERGAADGQIRTLVDAIYWGIAAFSTAGIADAPTTTAGKLIEHMEGLRSLQQRRGE